MVHDKLGKTITLPADYVAHTVQLGYATTVHGAQGITTGTCHVVLTGDEDRNLLYVALSRGRYANHLYLNVASDGDPHNLIRPEALIPPTALDQLTEMLRRDGSPVSATTTMRELTDPHQLLGDLAARYHDAVTTGAENLIGATGMDKIDAHAEALLTGLTEAPAWPTLRSHLALLALDEHNPLTLLTNAVAVGSLADARDPAAVLDARIDDLVADLKPMTGRPTPRREHPPPPPGHFRGCPASPPGWPTTSTGVPSSPPTTSSSVTRSPPSATSPVDWTGATAPAWAQPFLEDEDTDLRADLAVWRAVTHTPEIDLRPTGDRTIGAPGAHQAKLNRAVREARPSYPFSQRSWYQALPETVRQRPVDHPAVPAARPPRTRRTPRDRLHHPSAQDRPHQPGRPARRRDRRAAAARRAPGRRSVVAPRPAPRPGRTRRRRALREPAPTRLAHHPGRARRRRQGRLPAEGPRLARARRGRRRSLPAPRLDPDATSSPAHWRASPKTAASPASRSPTRSCCASPCSPTSRRPAAVPTTTAAPSMPTPADPDLLPPDDADEFMAAFYRDQSTTTSPVIHSPTPHEYEDLDAADRRDVRVDADRRTTRLGSPTRRDDPYLPPMPWQQSRRGHQPSTPSPTRTRSRPSGSSSSTSRHWPTTSPATRAPGRRPTCATASAPT